MTQPNRENLTLRDSPLVRFIGPIHLAIAAVEAWVGAFYTTVFVLLIGIPTILGAIVSPFEAEFGPKWAVAMLVVAVLWSALDVPFTLKTWQCVRNGARPLAPQVARRLNPWPGFLRLIQSLWFLAHFLIAAWFAHFTMEIAPPAMQEQPAAAHTVFTAVLAFFYTLAANGFLLAAIKTLTGRDSWVEVIWRWRVFIDLALVAVAMLWAVPGIRAG